MGYQLPERESAVAYAAGRYVSRTASQTCWTRFSGQGSPDADAQTDHLCRVWYLPHGRYFAHCRKARLDGLVRLLANAEATSDDRVALPIGPLLPLLVDGPHARPGRLGH